jgi:hypothetical protein
MIWYLLGSAGVVRQWSWLSVLVHAACIPLLPPPPGGAVCKPACSRGLSDPRSPAAFRFPPDRQPLACPPAPRRPGWPVRAARPPLAALGGRLAAGRARSAGRRHGAGFDTDLSTLPRVAEVI